MLNPCVFDPTKEIGTTQPAQGIRLPETVSASTSALSLSAEEPLGARDRSGSIYNQWEVSKG